LNPIEGTGPVPSIGVITSLSIRAVVDLIEFWCQHNKGE